MRITKLWCGRIQYNNKNVGMTTLQRVFFSAIQFRFQALIWERQCSAVSKIKLPTIFSHIMKNCMQTLNTFLSPVIMIMFNGHTILISHKTSSPPIPGRSCCRRWSPPHSGTSSAPCWSWQGDGDGDLHVRWPYLWLFCLSVRHQKNLS